MSSQNGRGIHAQVEHSREQEQDFVKSLQLAQEAIVAYQNDGDYRGLSEVLQSRSLSYAHLFEKTGDKVYLTLAKHDCLCSVEIAESLGDKTGLAMAYRGLGKIHEQNKDWPKAAEYLAKAVKAFEENPPEEHNRPAVLSDMKAHLAFAKYMSGDKAGLEMMTEAIEELTNSDEPKYNRDVWLSGAHMRAASMLKADQPEEARKHLASAKAIIDTNPELVLRKEHYEALTASFE